MSFPGFTAKSTADEVAAAFAEQIKGKNVLVTGTSITGVGFAAARAVAKYAGLVIITGRNSQRLQAAVDAIKDEFPSANVRPLVLDLASQLSVRKAATEVNAYPEPLHVLIHNAAAEIGPFILTEDNLESQFASDHVSPFLFTKLLAPKILASARSGSAPRVVFVSSGGHPHGTIDWDTLSVKPDESKYTALGAYLQAKIANILTAKALTSRSGGRIQSFSLHPGAIVTGIDDHPETLKAGQRELHTHLLPACQCLKLIHIRTVAAAFDPRLEGKGGSYLSDSVLADDQVSSLASDLANAERLWTITEDILGEKFTFD
ncbi:hypothetical protein C8F01DRAFT_984310 [Mycena amicta]|nr:hypothetical protein C8F01DRAFT_984310 [Mycena amicta]